MHIKRYIIMLVCLISFNLYAESIDNSSIQAVISQLEQDVKQAKNIDDVNAIFQYLHPNVLVVLENGRILHSITDLEKFIENPIYFDNVTIKKILVRKFSIDQPMITLGSDSALINGKIQLKYVLSNAKNFELTSHWTATLIKENNKWTVRSYQATSNIFNNPMLDEARYDFYFIIVVTLLIGAILGYFWKKFRFRK